MLSSLSPDATLARILEPSLCAELELHRASNAPAPQPHPFVIKYAQAKGLTELPAMQPGRLSALGNTSRLVHLTHIAKTGGRTLQKELSRIVGKVAGAEQCYRPFVHGPSRINVVFFREPRAHVLSQYLHGATVGLNRRDPARSNKKWSRRLAAGYPMGVDGAGLAGGFAQWAAHFAKAWSPARGDFFSYNPLNMQARSLTCVDEHWNCDYISSCDMPCSHHVGPNATDATPPLAEAVATVRSAHFIGVLELLPEALCVLEHRFKGRASGNCARPRSAIKNPGQGAASKRPTLSALSPSVLRDVDAITSVDSQVYREAVVRLLCDVAALEKAEARIIVKPERLLELRNKTGHVEGLWKS